MERLRCVNMMRLDIRASLPRLLSIRNAEDPASEAQDRRHVLVFVSRVSHIKDDISYSACVENYVVDIRQLTRIGVAHRSIGVPPTQRKGTKIRDISETQTGICVIPVSATFPEGQHLADGIAWLQPRSTVTTPSIPLFKTSSTKNLYDGSSSVEKAASARPLHPVLSRSRWPKLANRYF